MFLHLLTVPYWVCVFNDFWREILHKSIIIYSSLSVLHTKNAHSLKLQAHFHCFYKFTESNVHLVYLPKVKCEKQKIPRSVCKKKLLKNGHHEMFAVKIVYWNLNLNILLARSFFTIELQNDTKQKLNTTTKTTISLLHPLLPRILWFSVVFRNYSIHSASKKRASRDLRLMSFVEPLFHRMSAGSIRLKFPIF